MFITSLYLAWSVAAQHWVERIIQTKLPEPQAALLVTPSAFNTLLWRLVVMSDTHYYEGWYSLVANESQAIRWRTVPRDTELYSMLKDHPTVARLARFSDGFFQLERIENIVVMTDLRMGQEPVYVFRFKVGSLGPGGELAGPVEQTPVAWPPLRQGLVWLWQRLRGETILDLKDWMTVTAHAGQDTRTIY